MSQAPVVSIQDLSTYLQTLIGLDPFLQTLWVTGELSNVKTYGKSQTYFTLSDGDDQLQAVMFSEAMRDNDYTPKTGDTVFAFGRLSYYAKRGQLSFQVSEIKPKGAGQKSAAFLALQKKLQKEGLFDPSRKKTIPTYPEKILIITGKNSAAEADMKRILTPILPQGCLSIIHATVQGPESVNSLQNALKKAAQTPDCELIILARGGGSSEDLSSFNEESIVRLLSELTIPVITGIGHESDSTLSEQVADFRAATPTQAATLAGKGYDNFRSTLQKRLQQIQTQLNWIKTQTKEELIELLTALRDAPKNAQAQWEKHLNNQLKRCAQCNPVLKLQQGYTISRNETGKALQSITAITPGETLRTEVVDGVITSHVHCVEKSTTTGK